MVALVERTPQHVVPKPALAPAAMFALITLTYVAIWTLWPALTAGSSGSDLLFLADGARRIAAGQIPHQDFSLPTGVLPIALYRGAEILLPSMPPFIGMHLLGFLLLGPFLIAASARLPNQAASAALIGAVAIATLLPFNTAGIELCGTSLYASYNRFGAGFTLAFLAWFFRAGDAPVWRNALLLGFALLIAFSLKIVYLGIVLGPLCVYALLDARWRRAALLSLIAIGCLLATIELGGGLVSAYVADIRAMSAVNAARAPYFFASFVYKAFLGLLFFGGLSALLLLEKARPAWLPASAPSDPRRTPWPCPSP